MSKNRYTKGIALLLTLATIFIVMILGLVMLRPLSSQSRLTHHQVSRIQAYYAGLAGMNFAYQRIMTGDPNWPLDPPGAPPGGGFYFRDLRCGDATCGIGLGEIDEVNFPHSINSVLIAVAEDTAIANNPYTGSAIPGCSPCNAPDGASLCICTTVDYTFSS